MHSPKMFWNVRKGFILEQENYNANPGNYQNINQKVFWNTCKSYNMDQMNQLHEYVPNGK